MRDHEPYLENVPGDFYVEDGCCMMCLAPFTEAPELFGKADAQACPHCFVRRQPTTAVELSHMLNAMRSAETECIRYCGSDRLVQLELVATGNGYVCDRPLPEFQPEIEAQAAELERSRAAWQAAQQAAQEKPWWKFWA
jgi:hypothetical protein